MSNSKGSQNVRNVMYSGKHALLPPKSPFPIVSPTYTEFVPSSLIGSKVVQKPREVNAHHQRTSSESLLIEEQPSWLDDLLNEPDTPVRKGGHRRSSSDSFAYIDAANASNIYSAAQDEYNLRNRVPVPPRGSQEFDYQKDARAAPFYPEVNLVKQNIRPWNSLLSAGAHPGGLPSSRENIAIQSSGSSCLPQEVERLPSTENEKKEPDESGYDPTKPSPESKPAASESDTKRAKQQFAQRSRVRKLQYIAELERNVQALQAEGCEVSAELDFLNQQNLILNMENKALKQRLESLSQERLIKYLEHDVLEREISRLRAVYQQQQQHDELNQNQHHQFRKPQQQQQQPSSNLRRTKSSDLESQFANLSLNYKNANSSSVTGRLQI